MAISKKLIFSGLTAAAVLALTACGSNQNQTAPSSRPLVAHLRQPPLPSKQPMASWMAATIQVMKVIS